MRPTPQRRRGAAMSLMLAALACAGCAEEEPGGYTGFERAPVPAAPVEKSIGIDDSSWDSRFATAAPGEADDPARRLYDLDGARGPAYGRFGALAVPAGGFSSVTIDEDGRLTLGASAADAAEIAAELGQVPSP